MIDSMEPYQAEWLGLDQKEARKSKKKKAAQDVMEEEAMIEFNEETKSKVSPHNSLSAHLKGGR